MPQYRNEDDRAFGPELFMQAIDEREYCNSLINRYVNTEHWDVDRIALMDRLIMTVAISEVIHYPSIPTRVTLNEYIEIAKYYSKERPVYQRNPQLGGELPAELGKNQQGVTWQESVTEINYKNTIN